MSRPLRLELSGGLYHVTSRGDGREDIYLTDADRKVWLVVFANVCARFNWACHAWCQMSNHYHILIETPEANLAQGMRQLNGVYTQRFNRGHSRVGHVFRGRYKAILVERDSYLLELARYVVLNPLRAGMWSSAWRIGRGAAMERHAGRSRPPSGCRPTGDWRSSEKRAQTQSKSTSVSFMKVRVCRVCGPSCKGRYILVPRLL